MFDKPTDLLLKRKNMLKMLNSICLYSQLFEKNTNHLVLNRAMAFYGAMALSAENYSFIYVFFLGGCKIGNKVENMT